MKKIIVSLSFLGLLCTICCGQEIKLTVSGQGPTEQSAIDNALRNAIEQTFGSFVSANTTILDDELVKDEIVSVSKGNIKSFKRIGSVEKNGQYDVSLEAIVSVGNLVEYAKSRGSECELSGNAFTAEIRRVKLNQSNTIAALRHLTTQLAAIADRGLFDYSLVANPFADGSVDIKVNVIPNQNYMNFNELISSTLLSLALTAEQAQNIEKKGIKCSKITCYKNNREYIEYLLYNYDLCIGDTINEILANAFMNCYIKDNLGNVFFVSDGNRRHIVPLASYDDKWGILHASRESSNVHTGYYTNLLRRYSSYKLDQNSIFDEYGFKNDQHSLQVESSKIIKWNGAEYREIPKGSFTCKIQYSLEDLEKITGMTIENVKEDELYFVLKQKVMSTPFSLLTEADIKTVVEMLATLRFYRYYNLTDFILRKFIHEVPYIRKGDCYTVNEQIGLCVDPFKRDKKLDALELVNAFYYIDKVTLLPEIVKCENRALKITDVEQKQRNHEQLLDEATANWTSETLEERQMLR